MHKKTHLQFSICTVSFPSETEISVSSLFYYHLFAIILRIFFSAETRVSRQSNPTVSVTMEAGNQTEEKQVNIIEPIDPITPIDIGNFAPGTDSLDSDAAIENHERQLEQTLLQLKMAKSVAEAKQLCTTDLDDFDDEEDDFEDFFE
jgi:hypothetical protein